MISVNSKINMLRLWALWSLVAFVGWMIITYGGLFIRDSMIDTWETVPGLTWALAQNGCLLGLVIGALQCILLRREIKLSWWWVVVSAISYAVSTSIAFLLVIAILAATNPGILSAQGDGFLSMPLALTMLVSGAIIGTIQAVAVGKSFSAHLSKKLLLWILGTALGWGVGFFVISFAWRTSFPIFIQSGFAGLTIGMITGGVLITVIKQESAI